MNPTQTVVTTLPQEGDTIKTIDRSHYGLVYTVERPITTLPVGSVIRTPTGWVFIRTNDMEADSWLGLAPDSVRGTRVSDAFVRLDITDDLITLEYLPES